MKKIFIIAAVIGLALCTGCSDSDDSTKPTPAPAAPTGLSVTATSMTSLTLDWDAADGANEYNLYRSAALVGGYTRVYAGEDTSYEDTGLLYGATYYYQVSAENSGGESEMASAVGGETDPPGGFVVSGAPGISGNIDFNYLDLFNNHARYQSDPVGLQILVPSTGDQAGQWVFYDMIEGMNLWYHPTAADYPPPTGWLTVFGDAATSIVLTPVPD